MINRRRKNHPSTHADIFSLIKKDHRTVEQLFKKMESTTSRSSRVREKLFDDLQSELTRHSEAEEQLIYPVLRDHRQTKEMGFEATEEQAVMKELLKKVAAIRPNEDRWAAVVSVLKENTLHHAKEEEREMFPQMKKVFSKQELKELGPRFVEAKEGFLSHVRKLVGM
jgi:hemerythrin superfamily protein